MSPVPMMVWSSVRKCQPVHPCALLAPKKYPTPVLIRMSQVIRGLVNAM